MTRLLTLLLTLTNAFWLGGLATLVLLTNYMRRHDPAAATRSAPHIFAAFETYHLVLAAAALLLIVILWTRTDRSRARWVTTICLGIAIAAAIISASFITPRLAQLRRDGQVESPAFVRGHRASAICYGIESLAALGATLALPIWSPRRRQARTPSDRAAEASLEQPLTST